MKILFTLILALILPLAAFADDGCQGDGGDTKCEAVPAGDTSTDATAVAVNGSNKTQAVGNGGRAVCTSCMTQVDRDADTNPGADTRDSAASGNDLSK